MKATQDLFLSLTFALLIRNILKAISFTKSQRGHLIKTQHGFVFGCLYTDIKKKKKKYEKNMKKNKTTDDFYFWLSLVTVASTNSSITLEAMLSE